MILDEIHLLGADRGPILEVCVLSSLISCTYLCLTMLMELMTVVTFFFFLFLNGMKEVLVMLGCIVLALLGCPFIQTIAECDLASKYCFIWCFI